MIEQDFNVSFVARLAQREKQIQQSYRPIIGVHKWFARRPGALFRALLLAEFVTDQPLSASYFQSHDLSPRVVGDPFMGGGTPLIEANRLGCHIVGMDINPMAYWIVRQELAELNLEAFLATADRVVEAVEREIGELYETTCIHCGNPHASVKYFFWVKQQPCSHCESRLDLFSGYVLAKNQRHPNYVLVCPACKSLNEVPSLKPDPGACHTCGEKLRIKEPGGRNRVLCPQCGHENRYPKADPTPPSHHLFAMEYHCSRCADSHAGRFFKAADQHDQDRVRQAAERLTHTSQAYIPTDAIPAGDETARLHRWGYTNYRELFNDRQLLGLQTLAGKIAGVEDEAVRHALLTVFSDTLRYQNMLCRYDSYALKIIDIFSVHGFPVSVEQCENSLLGVPGIGSGGFRHFVKKYYRAKDYGAHPFEKSLETKKRIYLTDESIAASMVETFPQSQVEKEAYLQPTPAADVALPEHALDAVFTDPPYFANVQYAELMDFCYVWLRKHLEQVNQAFRPSSTRNEQELTVNETEERGIEHFTTGLSEIFTNLTRALKPGGPFAFTYHHNEVQAYLPIAVSILDSGLVCTVTLPCPAEMGASIHINGTKSSVIDTIFVCRTTGTLRARDFQMSSAALEEMLKRDIADLDEAGHQVSPGDARCILLGHMTRLAIWQLRTTWKASEDIDQKLKRVEETLQHIYPLDLLPKIINRVLEQPIKMPLFAQSSIEEEQEAYGSGNLSF